MPKVHKDLLELRKFVAPEFVFGVGSRHLAGRYANNFGSRKIMVVTDETLQRDTPWVRELQQALAEQKIEQVVFGAVSPNPRVAEVQAGANLFRQKSCNALIALGGGSVMDCAKGIGIVSSNGGHILDFEGVDKIHRAMPPLICIPTTSGTASEVSQFSIIMDDENKRKIAIVSKAVVPDVGLVDPELTVTMGSYLTACTGMDALTHAIEAYVSNASSPITDIHALEAIRIIWEALPRVLAEPESMIWRAQMLLGSLQAGLAFSNAILGAVHAMAHSLGGYLDLAHGECNAILLGPVMEYNFSANREKYLLLGEIFGRPLAGVADGEAARLLREVMEEFRQAVGIKITLRDLGVTAANLPILAEHALRDACLATNPRPMTLDAVVKVYEKAL